MENPITDLVNRNTKSYEVYGIPAGVDFSVHNLTLIKTFSDKKQAERRVFAENCSYRKKADQIWYIKVKERKEYATDMV
jgi:hypothetical protein